MVDQGNEGILSPFLRRQRIRKCMHFLFGKVLDVGCGSGALAGYVQPSDYFGIEPDETSRRIAFTLYPDHVFQAEVPQSGEFDTVALLAVIEHVNNPAGFMKRLANLTRKNNESRIVVTTPHPLGRTIHEFGANIGLFSSHAAEEHHALLDRKALEQIAPPGFVLKFYRRFLFGFNQIAVYMPLK